MYNFLSRNGQMLGLGLGLLITIIFFAIIGINSSEIAELSDLPRKESVQKLSEKSFFNLGLVGAMGLTILGALAIFAFGILSVVSDIKGSMKGLIGFGVLLVIFIAGYFIASGSGDNASVSAVIDKINNGLAADSLDFVTPGKSAFISGGLITTAVLLGLAFLGLVASEVMNFFR